MNVVKLFAYNCLVVSLLIGAEQHVQADDKVSAFEDFSPASNTDSDTWSYRFTTDHIRDGIYELIATFNPNVALNGNWTPGPNPGAWDNGSFNGLAGANNTGANQFLGAHNITWPAETLLVHPHQTGMVVISWLSPIDGVFDIQFSFGDADPDAGDGIDWFVELNDSSTTVSSGHMDNGSNTGLLTLDNINVTVGDRINFVVDSGSDFFHDSTIFTALIAVPEPTTLTVLALGGITLVRHRRVA